MTLSMSRALMCCLLPWSWREEERVSVNYMSNKNIGNILNACLTLFSIDFLMRLKLFQRKLNSCLCEPLKWSRSLMIYKEKTPFVCHTTAYHQHCKYHVHLNLTDKNLTTLQFTFIIEKRDLMSSSECSRVWSVWINIRVERQIYRC